MTPVSYRSIILEYVEGLFSRQALEDRGEVCSKERVAPEHVEGETRTRVVYHLVHEIELLLIE